MSPLDPLLDLLDRAMELPAAQREEFVREQCGQDATLLKRALPLIQEEQKGLTREWDLSSSRSLIAPVLDGPSYPLLGQEIGPWKLTRVLGEGGMGTVYLGDRMDEAFSQEVAVKVIREGVTHSQTLDRFHQERQIQAGLDHPAIAALIDAGHTENGQPYFVMEYVLGVRIDDHCESKDLSPEQRIRLMQEACDAVQYLHDRGIVHRDLKPSNLMVQPNGKAKLLDFGVAQVLNQTALTSKKPLPFVTPAYASPESLRGGTASPASDQYSLGVILYELLTDRRPTTRQSTLPDTDGQQSHVDFDKLQRGSLARYSPRDGFMRGLRAILARSLHDDPSERYASVRDFREDLSHLIENEPVLALGRSPWQTLRRTLRAHCLPIVASLVFIGALATILLQTQNKVLVRRRALALSEQSRKAAQDHAQTMERFAKEILLGLEGRLSQVPEASALRERSLAMGTAFFEDGHWNSPLPKRLLRTLLTSYWKLGLIRMASISQDGTHIEGARASFNKVLELAPLLAEEDPKFTNVIITKVEGDLGGLETDQLRLARGETLIRSSLKRYNLLYPTVFESIMDRSYLRTLIFQAVNHFEWGRYEEAAAALIYFESEFDRALKEFERDDPLFLGASRPLFATAGHLWFKMGNREAAARMLVVVESNDWTHPDGFRGGQLTVSLGQTKHLELQMLLQEPGPQRGDLATVDSLIKNLDRNDPKEIDNPASVAHLHSLRAFMLLERSQRDNALQAYMRNFRILRYSLRQDPDNAAWRDTLAHNLIDCAQEFENRELTRARVQSLRQEARGHLEYLRQNGADSPIVERLIKEIDTQAFESDQR